MGELAFDAVVARSRGLDRTFGMPVARDSYRPSRCWSRRAHALRLAGDGQSEKHPVAVQAPWEKLRATWEDAPVDVRPFKIAEMSHRRRHANCGAQWGEV